MKCCVFELLFVLVCFVYWAGGTEEKDRSFSTSISTMNYLIKNEKLLIDSLDKYINVLQNKLEIIRDISSTLRGENEKARQNPEKYLSNPINSYSLIRRMHSDWINLEPFLSDPFGEEIFHEIANQWAQNYTTSSDLTEAAASIHRLQETYDLKVPDIVNGSLNGKQYDVKLSAIDSYTIGLELNGLNMPYEAGLWTLQALESYEKLPIYKALNFTKLDIIELCITIMLHQDRQDDALNLINNALQIEPDNHNMHNRKISVEKSIKLERKPIKKYPRGPISDFQRGCRGEFVSRISRLHCRYNTTTTPFLRIAPLKMEEIHLEPYMVVFYDVLSDNEIEMFKEMASPVLKRAYVYNEGRSTFVKSKMRTSQNVWFYDTYNDLTIRINKRIEDMTGFCMKGSEMLQVMNYGLAGHYATHYDYFNVYLNNSLVATNGDRIATVLFYLSDVEQGGATIFPKLKTRIAPRKGSAVLWYNLNRNGKVYTETLHAACPVIVGSKWVCNKWIRYNPQFRKQPCIACNECAVPE